MAENKKDRMPWAFVVGVVALAIGVLGLVSGTKGPGPLIWLGIGVVLACTGLIQRSIERARR